MSSIPDPNWIAVTAALLSACGIGFLAKTVMTESHPSSSAEQRSQDAAQRRVSMTMGAPLLGAGLFTHALSQLATSTLNPLIVCLLLGLAFSLLIYAAVEDLAVDAVQNSTRPARSPARLALLPPATATETLREVAVESAPLEAAR